MRRHARPLALRHHPLALAAFLSLCTAPVGAGTVSWSGPNASFWDLAANWSAGVPGVADDVLLGAFDTEVRNGVSSVRSFTGTGRLRLSGGLLRASAASSIGVLDLAGGTLSGRGTVTATTLNWTAGTMGEYEASNFGGATTVTGLATISGAGGKQLYYGRNLNLDGGAVWSGAGSIGMTDATAIGAQAIPASVIRLAAGQTFTDQGSGTSGRNITGGVFENAGTYSRTAGSDFTYISAVFNNSGAVNTQAGTLRLAGGGTHTGSFSTLAGATLQIEGGNHSFTNTALANAGTLNFAGGNSTLAGTIGLNGRVLVSGGVVTTQAAASVTADTLEVNGGLARLRGAVPVGTLTLGGGTVSGPGALSVGQLNWTSGTMGEYEASNFGGSTTVGAATTLSGAGGKQLYYGRVLNLNGGATWSGAGSIGMTDATALGAQAIAASVINLPAGRTFTDQGSGTSGRSMTSGVFNNAGTYSRTAGADYTYISAQFNNSGAVDTRAGTLRLAGGGTHTGSFSTLAGATLQIEGGNHSFTNTPLANAGTLNFAGGSSTLAGTIGLNGNVVVSGGVLTSLQSSITTADALNLTGGTTRLQGAVPVGALTLAGGTVSGKGALYAAQLAWTSGTMGEYEASNFGGTTTVGGGTTITGAGGKQLYYGRVLTLDGGATWAGAGSIGMTDATALGAQSIAAATINLPTGRTFVDQGSGTSGRNITSGIFNNAGTYHRTAGSDYTYISAQFNNSGAVKVDAGTLRLAGGGTHTGSFATLSGATLQVEGGTHLFTNTLLPNAGSLVFAGGTSTLAGTIGLNGNVVVSGGVLISPQASSTTADSLHLTGGLTRLQGAVPVGTLTLAGGTLSGPGAASVETLAWTSGTMGEYEATNFGGSTSVRGTATISGAGGKQLYYGRVLNLNGGATWSGAGSIGMTDATALGAQAIGAAVINLPVGQSFTDQGSGTSGRNMTSGVFNNAGTYSRTAGSDYTYISAQFNNSGTVNTQAGTLRLAGGGTHTGSFATLAGATLQIEGGNHSFTSTPWANAGTLNFAGGNSVLAGTIALNGNVVVSGGVLTSGPATVLSAQSLNLTGGLSRLRGAVPVGALTVAGGTLSGPGTVSAGTLAWTSGTMGEYEASNFGGSTVVAGPTTISGTGGKQLYYGRSLVLDGGATWSGAGSIGMTDATALGAQAIAAARIVLPAGRTFNDQGSGTTSRNMTSGVFDNAGTYLKNGSADTTFVSSVFNNSGRVQVDAGVLTFTGATSLQGSGGTLQVGSAGRAVLTTGNSTVGTLRANGSAANALDLGARTITVHTDYDNANFGVGNAFNRRANVATTGTGNRIVAAGTTNQALTGAGITGGTTATPTLLLGAVHVGVNVIPYQIVNTGLTGPALRGAVQTVFAGGGITDARLSGTGTTAGNWGPLAAGDSLAREVIFTVDQAGLQTAVTNQSVRIVNNFDNTLSQVLAISSSPGWAAYNLAAPGTLAPVVLANQRVGGTLQAALNIANTAPAGGFTEALNASFGALAGDALGNGGSVAMLGGGQSNAAAMVLRLDTSAAGARSGTAVVQFNSDGAGTSNLGITALPSQTVAISGNVYRLAGAGALSPSPVVLAAQRVGGTATQALTLANTALADGYSERLNAAFVGTVLNGSATSSGAVTGLAAGASDATSLRVGVDTSTAGSKGGVITVALASDGAGTSGLAALSLGTQTVNVSGDVYRLANPIVTSALTLAARVGDALPGRTLQVVNSSPDLYTERLDASLQSLPTGFTGSGSITGLAAGGSSSALGVALASTATAGTLQGAAVVGLVSSGTGTTFAPDAPLAAAQVSLTGRVYAPAVARVDTSVVDFGIVRVGDAVAARTVSFSNVASGALTDTLQATLTAGGAPYAAGGAVGGVVAGGSGAVAVGLSTAVAGVYDSAATVAFASQNPDLADRSLDVATVTLRAQVNNVAQGTLARTSGDGSFNALSATVYTLDFGTVQQGAASSGAVLAVSNTATGPADALTGRFDLSAIQPGDAFTLAGFADFSVLEAGDTLGGLTVTFDSGATGSFDRVVVLTRTSVNGSGPDLGLSAVQLHLQGTVVAVPEPGTWVLMAGGLMLLGLRARAKAPQRKAA